MSYKPNFTIQSLLEAGVHFGHRKNHWNPAMQRYIYGVRNKVHIIDLKQTAYHLYHALTLMAKVASNRGKILFVNTKDQSTDIIKQAADRCSQYYVNYRWLGGMLTNWSTVSSSIQTLQNYENIIEHESSSYTKKELLEFSRKKDKLEKAIGGIRTLGGLPDILFVIDVRTHAIAMREANKLNIPVVAIVDTNSSPEGVDFVIPGNDDSRKSIELYCTLMADAIVYGSNNSILNSENVASEKKHSKTGINKKRLEDSIVDNSIVDNEKVLETNN